MTRFRRQLGDERGTSIVEMAMSLLIVAVLGLIVVAWLAAAGRSDQYHEASTGSLDALRDAKSHLVKEVRFAYTVSADPLLTNQHSITVWIDDLDQGQVGQIDTGIGEWVTWRITPDGLLVRTTDVPDSAQVELARGLLYDADGGADSSVFTFPAPDVVGIRLVAQQGGSGAGPQTIETQVRLRNS